MNNIIDNEQKAAAGEVRNLLASYSKNEDLINICAYVKGSDIITDRVIDMHEKIKNYLIRAENDKSDFNTARQALLDLVKN